MRVGIVGNGVVGNATGKAFEKHNVEVRYWDLKPERTTHPLRDVIETGMVFVCLPTPSRPDGSCDTSVLDEFFTNGPFGAAERSATFVIRSTVPVGFTRHIHEQYSYPNVYHWPEFLDAKTAERDACHPRCLILGKPGGWFVEHEHHIQNNPLYDFLLKKMFVKERLVITSSDESEMIKYTANCYMAVKNAFMNEMRAFADVKNLDWEKVVQGVLADGRMRSIHTKVPGPDGLRGFGGACLPKDLKAMLRQMAGLGVPCNTLVAAYSTNCVVRKEPPADAV